MKKSKSVAVVGAGFFGLNAALYLAKKGHKVSIFEKNPKAMQEASLFNQARIHGGYHYPRSLATAARCRANYSRFMQDFKGAVVNDFDSLYAIATDSKVNSLKFTKLMEMIGAPFEKLSASQTKDFSSSLIAGVYKVEEASFDAEILLKLTLEQLNSFDVKFYFDTEVTNLNHVYRDHSPMVHVVATNGNESYFQGVIMASYGLDRIQSKYNFSANYIYEVCELVKIDSPVPINHLAITVMDGPFWSLTPWPAFKGQILTHVRHTPHARFTTYRQAREFLGEHIASRSELMLRDAARYFPKISGSKLLGSEYTIKTILRKRDYDDARPINVQQDNRILSILGSKIDNIYEVEGVYDKFIEVI